MRGVVGTDIYLLACCILFIDLLSSLCSIHGVAPFCTLWFKIRVVVLVRRTTMMVIFTIYAVVVFWDLISFARADPD